MKLYYIPNVCSLASHILLNEMGIKYELERVDSKTKQTETGQNYLTINPKGYVPALELDTGEVITENIAVLCYLAEQDPQKLLMPSTSLGRARVFEWLGYLNAELHTAYVVFFREQLNEQEKEKAYRELNAILTYVNAKIEGCVWLVDNKFGPVDAYLYVMTEGSVYLKHDLTPYPNLVTFRQRMEQRSSFQLARQQEA